MEGDVERDIAEVEEEVEGVAPARDLVAPEDARPDMRRLLSAPLNERPFVRIGVFAWCLIGVLLVSVVLAVIVARVSTVVIPVVLALFPAALLTPASSWLKRRGVPPAISATLVLVGTLALVSALVAVITPQVAGQLDSLSESLRQGTAQVDAFLRSGPFGLDPVRLDDLVEQATEALRGSNGLGRSALGIAQRVFEGALSALLLLIVLWFYLKDGERIAEWVRDVFPETLRADAEVVGSMAWGTIGGYFRGQLLVALVDAIFIGIGLVVLRVPLAVPLAVLVFFGGLFPIVGAFLSGTVAVLVALATRGVTIALLTLVLVLAVQQLEGNLLQPLILGRATDLHPLAVILSLTVGGLLLGVLGAFLAVPVAAGAARAVGYLRRRVPG